MYCSISIFFPVNYLSVLTLLAVVAMEFLIGYFIISHNINRFIAWWLPIVSVFVIHFGLMYENVGFRMMALVVVLLTGMKVVVTAKKLKLPLYQWFLFCFFWIGMNPNIMKTRSNTLNFLWLKKGCLYISCGCILLLILTWRYSGKEIPDGAEYYAASIVLLVALSQILHFGWLNINIFTFQCMGFKSYSLFRSPLLAKSLQDFWGRRWNIPFIEMTSVAFFRPLIGSVSPRMAMFFVFIFSGFLHEIALSLPINNGYGYPMLYFVLQGCVTAFEPFIFKNKKPGSFWVISWLLLPLPILFHSAIMQEVLWEIVR